MSTRNQAGRVCPGSHNGELAGVDADDVDQVPDETVHACGVAPDGRGTFERPLAFIAFGGALGEQRRAQDDPVEQLAQVVADHSEEIVAVRNCIVGTRAFGEQGFVGRFALQRQQAAECTLVLPALAAQASVCARPLLAQGCVLDFAFFGNGIARRHLRRRMIELLVGLVARHLQHRVRVLARALHNQIRLAVDSLLRVG